MHEQPNSTDMNVVVLGGTIAAPPELLVGPTGIVRWRYLVSVRSRRPRRRVDVLPVTVWDPEQGPSNEDFCVGDKIWVHAALHRRFSATPEGQRSRLELVTDGVYRAT